MTKKTRRRFSPEDKVRILKRHLLEGVPVSDLCDEIGLHPNQFYQWQKQFFERGAAAFKPDRPEQAERSKAREIERLKAKLAKKDEVIGELSEEYVKVKNLGSSKRALGSSRDERRGDGLHLDLGP